ncbi:MAG TPA: ABC transporter permease [Gemmatimonadaceae bacterium]|nr:ABC transporter permease [Gemmatimonadaceae bacterium]
MRRADADAAPREGGPPPPRRARRSLGSAAAALLPPALGAVALVVAALGALALLLAASGYDAAAALAALGRGAFGSSYAFFSATLVRATPLILTGLAVALAFRGGVLNVGAEGQLLAGAAAAAAVGVTWGAALGPVVAAPAALAAAAAAGALWAWPAAELRRRFGVLEVISTIMLNFVALHGVSYLVRGPLQEPTRIYPQTSSVAPAAQLPHIVPGTRLHAGFAIAVVAAALLWWAMRATAAGFRLRVVGANPHAAASAGMIDVARTTTRAFLVSGALAGLAGGVEVTGVTYALYENISPGYGYTAIAVALLAGLDPALVVASGVFFGALEAGAGAMQRDAGVPSVVVSVVEALIVLLLLAADRWRTARRRRAGGDASAAEDAAGVAVAA